MKIKKHIVNPLQVNCYLVWDEESREAMCIDPGGGVKKLARSLSEKGLNLRFIFHTHDHWDHVAGSLKLQKLFPSAVILRHPKDNKAGFFRRELPADGRRVRDLEDGGSIRLGGLEFQVIHTPGHSRGSVCLFYRGVPGPGSPGVESLLSSSPVLFTGDLLFKQGVGRTDLKGGDMNELLFSLAVRLARVPDHTVVYPGHGPKTAMGEERSSNPFFKLAQNAVLRRE